MKETRTDLLLAEVVEAMRLKVPFVLVGEYLNELNSQSVKADEIGELRQRDNTAEMSFFHFRSAGASQTHNILISTITSAQNK